MDAKLFLNQTVSNYVGCKAVEGERFGVELELEGRNVGLADVATRGWQRHNDGSLRGESIEYTTTGAKTLDESVKLVSALFEKFAKNNVQFNSSVRTSTHVHLNFSDKLIKHVFNFFTLFTMLEEVLQFYSGEDRKGNLFCISTREAQGIVDELGAALLKSSLGRFGNDRYKYAACNLSTLFKFGTVEVRTMRGATSAAQVNSWLNILNDMYIYACKEMRSPADLIRNLSLLGSEGLMKCIFKPANLAELMSTFPPHLDLRHSLLEGLRILQVFAFVFDEDFTAEVVIPEKKLGQSLPRTFGRGGYYVVYRAIRGNIWITVPNQVEGFWQDGEVCKDTPSIAWNESIQRFVETLPNGDKIPLNWKTHPNIPDEGPVGLFGGLRREEEEEENVWEDDEPEEIPILDDEDDDHDIEF